MMNKCPKCGSERIAPIIYRKSELEEISEQQITDEKMYICRQGNYIAHPKYYCFKCKRKVGSLPIFVGKYGKEDYRDIIISFRFYCGGFFGGYPEVTVNKETDRIFLNVIPPYSFDDRDKIYQREMTEKEWSNLLDNVYCKAYVHEWDKKYNNPDILDGTQWGLELKLVGGRVREYCGSNAFPPYWDELESALRPYFNEAGIEF